MAKVLKVIIHEIRELLPAFIFFLLTFSLIIATDTLVTEEYGLRPFHIIGAVVLALVVAKVLLLANLLPFVNAFPDKPLIYNTLWKTLLYMIFANILVYLEHLIEYIIRYGSLASANQHLIEKIVWPRYWAIQIWLAVLLFVFTAFQELTRTLGEGRLRRMFFGR